MSIEIHTPGEQLPLPAFNELLESQGVEVRTLLKYGIGIDTHKQFIQVCVLAQLGGAVRRWEKEFPTDWNSLNEAREWALRYAQCGDPVTSPVDMRYTIESTGCYHMPVLQAWKGQPSVVNPTLAGATRRKTDVLDARTLAHHSLCALWATSFIPSSQSEQLRVLLAMRYEAARNATRATNRINNHILRFGHTLGREQRMADPVARACIEDMCRGVVPVHSCIRPDGIPSDVRCFFRSAYKMFDEFSDMRDEYHDLSLAYVKKNRWPTREGFIQGDKLLKCLVTVPGVGEVTALAWLSVVCDPRRFADSKQVAAYCGCDPSLKVSAGKVTSHVKRKGNGRLHHALKNVAAQLVRRKTDPVGMWGFGIFRRHAKGGWARAINAVSRRLAVFLWHVHLRGEEFDYDRYRFYEIPAVLECSLAEMNLPKRVASQLEECGLLSSVDVARAFSTTLPQKKGIGAGCLAKVKEWIDANRKQTPEMTPSAPVRRHRHNPPSPVKPAARLATVRSFLKGSTSAERSPQGRSVKSRTTKREKSASK